MDMDLVLVFGFVSTLVLIITLGVVLFPISRKLGHFLEQAALDRAERLGGTRPQALPEPASERMLEALAQLQHQVGQLAERQAFTERLLEERPKELPIDAAASDPGTT